MMGVQIFQPLLLQVLRLAACLLGFLGSNMSGRERTQLCPELASQKKKEDLKVPGISLAA